MPFDVLEGIGDLFEGVCDAGSGADAAEIISGLAPDAGLETADAPADMNTGTNVDDTTDAGRTEQATRPYRRSSGGGNVADLLDAVPDSDNSDKQKQKENEQTPHNGSFTSLFGLWDD